jgi:acyl-CoA thioester hydrolase
VAPFTHDLRVRFAECDPQGVVFNSHYLAYFDVAMTELWRAAFGSYGAMLERGIDMVVVEAQLSFHAPGRFDDLLTLEVVVSRLGNTSMATQHRITRDRDTVVEGTLHHVIVDRTTLQKVAIPDWIRRGLEPWSVDDGARSAQP